MFKIDNEEGLKQKQIKDLCNYLAEQMGIKKLNFQQIKDIIKIQDTNKDGCISFPEFLENIDTVNEYIEKLKIDETNALN